MTELNGAISATLTRREKRCQQLFLHDRHNHWLRRPTPGSPTSRRSNTVSARPVAAARACVRSVMWTRPTRIPAARPRLHRGRRSAPSSPGHGRPTRPAQPPTSRSSGGPPPTPRGSVATRNAALERGQQALLGRRIPRKTRGTARCVRHFVGGGAPPPRTSNGSMCAADIETVNANEGAEQPRRAGSAAPLYPLCGAGSRPGRTKAAGFRSIRSA